MSDVYSGADLIDSRDVIERIAEILPFHVEAVPADETSVPVDLASCATREDALATIEGLSHYGDTQYEVVEYEDEAEELRVLTSLVEDINSSSGDSAEDGVTLISDSYFTTYAQDLANDLGFKAEGWPGSYIDWEWAARDLKMDYTSIDYDGETYWVR